MRVVALATTITVAVASVGLSGCASRSLVYPGYYAGYSGAPYAPAAVVYPEYGVPPTGVGLFDRFQPLREQLFE